LEQPSEPSEISPGEQLLHPAEPAALTKPTGQSSHVEISVAPIAAENVPALHRVQAAVSDDCPVVVPKVPALQSWQFWLALAVENLPSGQESHESCAETKDPAPQLVHDTEPADDCLPASQDSQVADESAPVAAE
jgi:hypothetical protein